MAPYDREARRKREAMANILAGQPNVPAAPEQGMFGMGAGGNALARGGAAGAMIGGAAGGPVGALAGAAIGAGINRLRMGTPSDQAQSALDAGWDGFGGQPSGQAAPQPSQPAGGRGPIGAQPSAPQAGNWGQSPNAAGYNGGVSANLDAIQGAQADPWRGCGRRRRRVAAAEAGSTRCAPAGGRYSAEDERDGRR